MIHTLAEVPGSRALLQHNGTRDDASELYEGGSLTDVVAAASAASPQQVSTVVGLPPIHHSRIPADRGGESACMLRLRDTGLDTVLSQPTHFLCTDGVKLQTTRAVCET